MSLLCKDIVTHVRVFFHYTLKLEWIITFGGMMADPRRNLGIFINWRLWFARLMAREKSLNLANPHSPTVYMCRTRENFMIKQDLFKWILGMSVWWNIHLEIKKWCLLKVYHSSWYLQKKTNDQTFLSLSLFSTQTKNMLSSQFNFQHERAVFFLCAIQMV